MVVGRKGACGGLYLWGILIPGRLNFRYTVRSTPYGVDNSSILDLGFLKKTPDFYLVGLFLFLSSFGSQTAESMNADI